ncbi:hypothetical protein AMET1_1041 [Methanonatronarchaeum thermophilum]|uniref:Uncharacterized protein n=1 Tax=Methanonatronarchaeum thermophilum TaxID=1927129 RepID=A0A1Y3G9Q5_9EURY|nr:hypothetical protein [Methanonatronarchaeum thermophilum]OUJ18139.1 hypothetical protein AMET1_1041 [Methanonatronarchaeum thermophilum]
MSSNKMLYAVAAICLALVLAFTAYGVAGFPGIDEGQENGIEVVDLNQTVSGEVVGDDAVLVDRDDGDLIISGQIVGNTAGQTVYVESIETGDDKVVIYMDTELEDGTAAMVITQYDYELELSDVPIDHDVFVYHGDEVFELTGDSEIKEL